MGKQCYGMVINKNGTDWVKELSSTEQYERYCSYLMHVARDWKLNSVEQFIQYFYRLYYNPEWKPNEQYYQGNRSLAQEPFFNKELDDLVQGYTYRLQYMAHMSAKNSYGFYLAKIGLNGKPSTVYNNDTDCYVYTCVTIKHVIKPQEIWKSFSNNHTFEKHMIDKKYGCTLASLKWYKY